MLRNKEIIAFAAGATGLAVSASFLEPQANTNIVNNAGIAYAEALTPEVAHLQAQGLRIIDNRNSSVLSSEALLACGEFNWDSNEVPFPAGPTGQKSTVKLTLMKGQLTRISGGYSEVNAHPADEYSDPNKVIITLFDPAGRNGDALDGKNYADIKLNNVYNAKQVGTVVDPERAINSLELKRQKLRALIDARDGNSNVNEVKFKYEYWDKDQDKWLETEEVFTSIQTSINQLTQEINQECATQPTVTPTTSPTVSPTPEKSPTPVQLPAIPATENGTACAPRRLDQPITLDPNGPEGQVQEFMGRVAKAGFFKMYSTGNFTYKDAQHLPFRVEGANQRVYVINDSHVEGANYDILAIGKSTAEFTVRKPVSDRPLNPTEMHSYFLTLAMEDQKRGVDEIVLVYRNGVTGELNSSRVKVADYIKFAKGECPFSAIVFVPAAGNKFEAAPVINSPVQPNNPEQPTIAKLPEYVPNPNPNGIFDPDNAFGGWPEGAEGANTKKMVINVRPNTAVLWEGGLFRTQVMENGIERTYEVGYDNNDANKRGKVLVMMYGGQNGSQFNIEVNQGVRVEGFMSPNSGTFGLLKWVKENTFKFPGSWKKGDGLTIHFGESGKFKAKTYKDWQDFIRETGG